MPMCSYPGCTASIEREGRCAEHISAAPPFSLRESLNSVGKAVGVAVIAGFALLVLGAGIEGYKAITTPGKVFDRFREGNCYITVFENGKPGTWVTKVLGKAPDGAYILFDVVPADSHQPGKGSSYTLTEEAFRNDEQKFKFQFKKVSCP